MKLVAWSLIAGKTTLSAFLVSLVALLLAPDQAAAQGFGGRTATVSVAEAQEDVLAIFVEVQGRVAAGQVTAITASINAVTTLEDLRIGDLVKAGQVIAQQDSGDLQNRLDILSSQRREAGLRVDEVETGNGVQGYTGIAKRAVGTSGGKGRPGQRTRCAKRACR